MEKANRLPSGLFDAIPKQIPWFHRGTDPDVKASSAILTLRIVLRAGSDTFR
jgi:hypothetical protein